MFLFVCMHFVLIYYVCGVHILLFIRPLALIRFYKNAAYSYSLLTRIYAMCVFPKKNVYIFREKKVHISDIKFPLQINPNFGKNVSDEYFKIVTRMHTWMFSRQNCKMPQKEMKGSDGEATDIYGDICKSKRNISVCAVRCIQYKCALYTYGMRA